MTLHDLADQCATCTEIDKGRWSVWLDLTPLGVDLQLWFRDTFDRAVAENLRGQVADVVRALLVEGARRAKEQPMERPKVVVLCGSTRFYEAFQRANYEETMAGRIVLSVGFYPHSSELAHGQALGCDDEQKKALDELHFRKIDLADEVLILNCGGYIGSSTANELAYARSLGKPVRFLEQSHE